MRKERGQRRGGAVTSIAFACLTAATLAACSDASPVQPAYDDAAIAYFGTIAFGTEDSGIGPLRRWSEDIDLSIEGAPTAAHIATVEAVVADLNELIGTIDIRIVDADAAGTPDVRVLVVTWDSLAVLEPVLANDNAAVFRYWWNADQEIYTARAIISYDVGPDALQMHWIREEVTQLFGLGHDTWDYEESIFYAGYSETTAYAPIDRSVIRMLYDPRLRPGMTREQALGALD